MSSLGNYFGRVIKVRIHGTINKYMSNQIYQQLSLLTCLPSKAILVSINSSGGSLTQAKNVSQMLINFKKQKNIPLYCFAEEQCLSAANIVFSSGDKCYANRMSLLGGYNFVWSQINLSSFAQKNKIKQQSIVANSTGLKYNYLQPLKNQTQAFTRNQLKILEADLKQRVLINRKSKLQESNMNIEQIERNIFSQPVSLPDKMLKYNLIDGIKNSWQLMQQMYKGSVIRIVNRHQTLDFVKYAAQSQHKNQMLGNMQEFIQQWH